MKRFLAAVLIAVLLPGAAAHADVPDAIAVPKGHEQFLKAHAVGVQIYSCNATATGHAWGLVAPRANLYDKRGRVIGTALAEELVRSYLGAKFTGEDRHVRRLNKVIALEKK